MNAWLRVFADEQPESPGRNVHHCCACLWYGRGRIAAGDVRIAVRMSWCSIRETVFSWTRTRFPLHIRCARTLKLIEAPIITVTGKAFWDVGHAAKDQSNRRKYQPGYAAWEIHPVMKLETR
jgi:hypothetical protein